MTGVGGFLPLEPAGNGDGPYHSAACLRTGRACLRLILEIQRPTRIHVPFFICNALLQPIRRHRIPILFYALDGHLRPRLEADVADGELLVLVRYFGLGNDGFDRWREALGTRLVIDDSQAFFHREPAGSWSFNSARKFFGLPDGAYLHGPLPEGLPKLPEASPVLAHLESREMSDGASSYERFRDYEAGLDDSLQSASTFTRTRLADVDYVAVAAARRRNFTCLANALSRLNELDIPLGDDDVPLYYPFLGPAGLREALIRRKIWVPQLWREVAEREAPAFSWERHLASCLCPLPIDQRYGAETMLSVSQAVEELTIEAAGRPS